MHDLKFVLIFIEEFWNCECCEFQCMNSARKALDNRTTADEEHISQLETQLKAASDSVAETDRKFEEVLYSFTYIYSHDNSQLKTLLTRVGI